MLPLVPLLLSEVEQEQRPSGNRDREPIVVGAGLCEVKAASVHTPYMTPYKLEKKQPRIL